MKIRWILLTFMVLSLVLTACGGDSGGDASAPVKDFFDAMAEKDAEKASKAVCKEYRDGVKNGLGMIFDLMGDDDKFEVTGLKLKVKDEKDNEAMVYATAGKQTTIFMGETEEKDLADDDDPLKVIKEDGKWLICDPGFAEGFGP